MAKLYWVSAKISTAGADTSEVTISNLIVSDDKITQEDERATIDDNQDIQIQLDGTFSFETRNLTFDGGASAILDSALVNTDGATKARLKLTANDGTVATLDNVYVNARKKIISTGEIGVMLDAKRSDEVSADPVSYV